ncbi:hypothetical protein FRC04_007896 [Tulasnella sp. 424]|nr:hypothetical protein FRC04_007896 [Tulasnella sp. 424]
MPGASISGQPSNARWAGQCLCTPRDTVLAPKVSPRTAPLQTGLAPSPSASRLFTTSRTAHINLQVIKSDISSSISRNIKIARGNFVTDESGCALADYSTEGLSNLDSATQAYCQGQETVYRNAAAGDAFWSYMMDDFKPGDGNGWCFKGSVANILPKTFFPYEAQTELVDGILRSSELYMSNVMSLGPNQTKVTAKETLQQVPGGFDDAVSK